MNLADCVKEVWNHKHTDSLGKIILRKMYMKFKLSLIILVRMMLILTRIR